MGIGFYWLYGVTIGLGAVVGATASVYKMWNLDGGGRQSCKFLKKREIKDKIWPTLA
jgi:acetyltransferase-like isoleucine patch superfamily enzyme